MAPRARQERNAMTQDWTKINNDLERLLKLRSFVFGMKMFEKREDMEAIPRIRRPQNVHTLDQVVGQASRLGWTVGITADQVVGGDPDGPAEPRRLTDHLIQGMDILRPPDARDRLHVLALLEHFHAEHERAQL